jgi:RNA polymerase sigma factor (sigma-70 family)
MSATAVRFAQEEESRSSDERLVKECLSGHQQAWSELIDKYKNLIFSIPIKYEFSREDASDIFQSVCLLLLSELPRLREPRALAKWLIHTTSHECLHWKRREQRYVAAEENFDVADQSLSARAQDIIFEAEQEQILRDSLSGLQPRCAQMIQSLFFDTPARPYGEIATQLGLATGSIGFTRRRCLDQLKKQLLQRGWK